MCEVPLVSSDSVGKMKRPEASFSSCETDPCLLKVLYEGRRHG